MELLQFRHLAQNQKKKKPNKNKKQKTKTKTKTKNKKTKQNKTKQNKTKTKNILLTRFSWFKGATIKVLGAKGQWGHLLGEGVY